MNHTYKQILVIDEDIPIYQNVWSLLEDNDYGITIVSDRGKALKALDSQHFDMLLINIGGPVMQELELLRAAKQVKSDIPIMIAFADSTATSILKAIRAGAVDYLQGPIEAESVLRAINQVFDERQVALESCLLPYDVQESSFSGIITKSPKMLRMLELIERLSDVDSTVLITGETGVGKELVARAIHFTGARKNMPFVAINCGALTETLLESELFGHEKGAFTGAFKSKAGKFECAHKGTLFLDEIGDISPTMQVKMLRALQERKVERVGGTHTIDVDVRVVSATNQNIKEKINSHEFRIDLFYRLNVIPIHVPPLRERPEDIPLLVRHFIIRHNESLNRKIEGVTPRALKQMMDYPWPGNVRELENIVERAYITCDSHVIDQFTFPQVSENLPSSSATDALEIVNTDVPFSVARSRVLKNFERAYLIEALKRCEGNVSQTAQKAGVNPRTLWRKLKEHRLDRMSFMGKN
ncbi:MAG: sigma-54 dependent transcriptional regulator [Syntrophobacteraceae bacterium]